MKYLLLISLTIAVSFVYAQEKLKLYSKAPDFKGVDQFGKDLSLSELLEDGPVVVLFYRGQWCPHCNRYMSHLQDSAEMIDKLGARIVAITPEKLENIAKTMLKTNAKFSIIYDENHKIMDDYKVTFELGYGKHLMYNAAGININRASGNSDRALPVPATYIIDVNRRIIGAHFDENYSERMSIAQILNILKKRNDFVESN